MDTISTTSATTIAAAKPLRKRMQQDMMMRGLLPRTQEQYIRHVRRFAGFLGRSPDTATPEDLRNFQVHQHEKGASAATINGAVSALRFFLYRDAQAARTCPRPGRNTPP
jgi:integrase/recombinase XerD